MGMDPALQHLTRPGRADAAGLLHFLVELSLAEGAQVEIAGAYRALRIEFRRSSADKYRATQAAPMHRLADPRQQAKRGFELGAVGGDGGHSSKG